jgi:hypothetical protein
MTKQKNKVPIRNTITLPAHPPALISQAVSKLGTVQKLRDYIMHGKAIPVSVSSLRRWRDGDCGPTFYQWSVIAPVLVALVDEGKP